MKTIKYTIEALGTALSIISLAFSSFMQTWLTIVIVIFGLSCFFFLIYENITSNAYNERVCRNNKAIEEAMNEIINSHGNICIMSRDLSWITPQISATLESKKDNVLIFAQSQNAITSSLVNKGIKVKYYADLGFEPKTRFTIIRYNKNNPQVAIANMENNIRKKNKFKHIIYQTSPNGTRQDEWINSLAIDMVQLCNIVCKEL